MNKLTLVVFSFTVVFQVMANDYDKVALPLNFTGRPLSFKLDQSTNNKLCASLSKVFNQDIENHGKINLNQHIGFLKWRNVKEENVYRGENNYDGQIEQMLVDINNDGKVDKIIRSKWLIRGTPSDQIFVVPKNTASTINIDTLIKTDNSIDFNSGKYSINSYEKKHGHENYDWYFDGVASINLYRHGKKTYVVAHNYAAPDDISAKIYVFYLNQNYAPQDVCMFVKTCTCEGCKDLSGEQLTKTMPAKNWCK